MSLSNENNYQSLDLSSLDKPLLNPSLKKTKFKESTTDFHTDGDQKVHLAPSNQELEKNDKILIPVEPLKPIQEENKKISIFKKWEWLFYAFGGCIFAAIGQFMMDWMSMGFESRFTIALGDFVFVFFFGVAKFLYNSYKKKSFCTFKDSEWCDQKTGKMKEGSFKYLFVCVLCRLGYGFLIIYALYLANDCNMNGGLLFAIRTSEALFVAIWTRIFLKEKLTNSKIVGLLILIAGVVGLSIPNNSSDEKTGFSVLAAILALVAALVSSLRNYSVKFLGKKKISGDNITFGAVIGADFITIIIGAFLCIGGWGFNATNYNNYYKEYMDEITWQRFLWSLFVGFSIYFSLSFTANGNQKGYAG